MIPSMATTPTRPSGGLVLVRITLGFLSTWIGWSWATGAGLPANSVRNLIQNHAEGLNGLARFWGESVVLYNADASAFLAAWGTLLAGVACTIGLLTRPAASVLAFLALHLAVFGAPELQPAAWLATAAALGCALSRAGRSFGLDRALDGNLPSWLTWVKSTRNSPF